MKHLAQWRSVLGGSGGQCVITVGIIQMQLLFVDNLDSVQKVFHSVKIFVSIIMILTMTTQFDSDISI